MGGYPNVGDTLLGGYLGRPQGYNRLLTGGSSTIAPVFGASDNGDILWDGSCYDPVSGAVFGSTAQVTAGNQQIYKWADPTDPSTFSKGNLYTGQISALAWDSTSSLVWATAKSSTRTANIGKTNPTTLVLTAVVSQVVGTVGKHLSGNSPLVTDGTHLYYGASMTDENSWLYKFRCSDGGQVASIHLGSQPGGAATSYMNSLVLGGDGFLYAGGGLATVGWAARIPTDLSAATVIVSGITTNDDDSVGTPGFFWLGDEGGPQIAKVARDLSSSTLFNYSSSFPSPSCVMDGIDYDGQYLWVGFLDIDIVGGPHEFGSAVLAIDPANGAIIDTFYLDGNAGDPHTSINEVIRVPTGFFAMSYLLSGFNYTWMAFQETS